MRVDIKTNGKVKDPDIKALYLIQKAMELSTDKMREANVRFIVQKWGIDHEVESTDGTISDWELYIYKTFGATDVTEGVVNHLKHNYHVLSGECTWYDEKYIAAMNDEIKNLIEENNRLTSLLNNVTER